MKISYLIIRGCNDFFLFKSPSKYYIAFSSPNTHSGKYIIKAMLVLFTNPATINPKLYIQRLQDNNISG